MKDLNDLFQHELKDMYSAENQLAALLPKMIEKAANTELKNAFKRFINNIPFYGAAIICIDDPTIQSIISEIEDKRFACLHKTQVLVGGRY